MKLHISNRPTSSLLMFTIFSLILLTWCTSYAGDDKGAKGGTSFFNDKFAKVSYGLALLEANARYMDEMECYVQRLFEEHAKTNGETEKANPSEISRLFERRENEEKEWCAVFADVAKDTKDIAQAALQTHEAPSGGFLFYAWRHENLFSEDDKEHEESKYRAGKFPPGQTGEPVGLFKTIESCQAAEARIRKLDTGTRPCRSWTNSWFATAQAPREKSEAILDFGKALWGAAGTLFSAILLFWIYQFARTLFASTVPKSSGQRIKDYLYCMVVAAFIALTGWNSYGWHYEGDDDSGEYVQDFKPTKQERNEHGVKVFLVFLVPVWLGVTHAHNNTPKIL